MLTNLPELLQGAGTTILASSLAIVLGLAIGIVAAVARESRYAALRVVAICYVSMIRGTPLYIQLLTIYFLFPAIGIDLPRFTTGVIALGLNSGSYISEMIRGAITSVGTGQIEAARALAMPMFKIKRRIVLPQALRLILPPLTLELTALVKNSAFLSVIGVIELTRTAQQIISVSFQPTQTWVIVAAIYFVLCFALGAATRRIEVATGAQGAR
jgi:His/Glu/Gln/Arg/opine family amino acid ABC transporter permease subunit